MAVAKKTTKKATKKAAKRATKRTAPRATKAYEKVSAEQASKLSDWQVGLSLNDRDASKRIGLSRNTYIKYRDAFRDQRKPLPRVVSLALSALLAGAE